MDTLHPLWHWLPAGQELSVADGVGPVNQPVYTVVYSVWSWTAIQSVAVSLDQVHQESKGAQAPKAEMPYSRQTDKGGKIKKCLFFYVRIF